MPRRERDPLTKAELETQAKVTPDDKLRAAEEWRRAASAYFKFLLDAEE